jgi:hypothetical protein
MGRYLHVIDTYVTAVRQISRYGRELTDVRWRTQLFELPLPFFSLPLQQPIAIAS